MPRRRVTETGVWEHERCPSCDDPSFHLGIFTPRDGGRVVSRCLRCGTRQLPPSYRRRPVAPKAPPPPRPEVGVGPGLPGIAYAEAPQCLRAPVGAELRAKWPGLPEAVWSPLVRFWEGELALPVQSYGLGLGFIRRRIGEGAGPRYRTAFGLCPGWVGGTPSLHPVQIIIAEGWADALAWRRATGIPTLVAGGTRPNLRALAALLPWTTEILIGFDGDRAGIEGARSLERALRREWRKVRTLVLPSESDPAELPASLLCERVNELQPS